MTTVPTLSTCRTFGLSGWYSPGIGVTGLWWGMVAGLTIANAIYARHLRGCKWERKRTS